MLVTSFLRNLGSDNSCVWGISASDLNLFQLGCVICVGLHFKNLTHQP